MEEYITKANGRPFDSSRLNPGFISDEDYRTIHEKSVIPCHDIYVECEHNGNKGILLVARKEVPCAGQLWPLGGRILKGVPIQESVKRKVKEESRLEAFDIQELGVARVILDEDRFGHGRGYDSIAVNYFVRSQGNLELNNLHENPTIVNWRNYEQIEKNLHPYVRRFLREAMRKWTTESITSSS